MFTLYGFVKPSKWQLCTSFLFFHLSYCIKFGVCSVPRFGSVRFEFIEPWTRTRTELEPIIPELEPNPNPWYSNSNRTRTYDTWTRTEPELYLWVRFGFSSKFMNKFGFNHVIRQTLHALKLLNKKNFFW